jgi:DNA-binding NarL/FixJ family response regulator
MRWLRVGADSNYVKACNHPNWLPLCFEDDTSMELPEPLTKKESEVLALMTAGLSNKEIAESMGVTEATIKTHMLPRSSRSSESGIGFERC